MTEIIATDRILPLTHVERAMLYAIEHNEHVHIAQVLAYVHWARARGRTLDAPYQPTLPTAQEAPTTEPMLPELDDALNEVLRMLDDEEGALT